jgi:hypothetical protein
MIAENKTQKRLDEQPADLRVTTRHPLRLAARRLQGGQTATGAGPATAAVAFAAALLARYLARGARWARLGLFFRQERSRGTGLRQYLTPLQVRVAPHLHLTLLRYGGPSTFAPPIPMTATAAPDWSLRQPVGTGHAEARPVDRIRWRGRPARRGAAQRSERVLDGSEITHRLLRRATRVEMVADPGHPLPRQLAPGAEQPVAATAPARPVRRVLRRTAGGDEEEPSARPFTRQERQFGGHDQLALAVDINRVTEQVMQQLDRRILAHRERTGRI